MKIIKTGRLYKEVIRFVCEKCGCIFEADENEVAEINYDWGISDEDKDYVVRCPMVFCGNEVFGKMTYIQE